MGLCWKLVLYIKDGKRSEFSACMCCSYWYHDKNSMSFGEDSFLLCMCFTACEIAYKWRHSIIYSHGSYQCTKWWNGNCLPFHTKRGKFRLYLHIRDVDWCNTATTTGSNLVKAVWNELGYFYTRAVPEIVLVWWWEGMYWSVFAIGVGIFQENFVRKGRVIGLGPCLQQLAILYLCPYIDIYSWLLFLKFKCLKT